MKSPEWSHWKAFSKLRPFGEAGADLRNGIMTAAVTNMWRRRSFKAPLDYMPIIRQLLEGFASDEPPDVASKVKSIFAGIRARAKQNG